MRDPLTPCIECGYGLPKDPEFCPNCGLSFVVAEFSFMALFLDRGTKKPKRNPENFQTLQAKLQEEVVRLQDTVDRLGKTRGPLQQRRDQAATSDRSTRALDEALTHLDHAAREADLLKKRHQGLLTGITLDRRHNALLLVRDQEERAEVPPKGAPPLSWQLPFALRVLTALPKNEDMLALSADGSSLLWLSSAPPQLQEPFQAADTAPDTAPDAAPDAAPDPDAAHHTAKSVQPTTERYSVPGPAGATLLVVCGDWAAIAGAKTAGKDSFVQLFHLPSRSFKQAAKVRRGQVVAMDLQGHTLLVGSEGGTLLRFSLGPLGARLQDTQLAHPFGLSDVILLAGGKRAMSCGGGLILSWWLSDSGFTQFHQAKLPGATRLIADEPGGRLLVMRAGRVAHWDLGLTKLHGEVSIAGDTLGAVWAPDGQRLLLLRPSGVELASLRTRTRRALLLSIPGRVQCVALSGDSLVVAAGNPVMDTLSAQRLPLSQAGPSGASLVELSLLRALVQECRRYVPKGIREQVQVDQVLLEQARAFVGDAARLTISHIVGRAALAESQGAAERIPAFELLFEELDDLMGGLDTAADLAGDLGPSLRRLVRLPTAVLLGQVDAILAGLESVLGCESTEQALDHALSQLQGLERWLSEIERLSNGLQGRFWGTPDRRLLVEALRRLTGELPEVADALHARLAATVVGRVDTLSGEHTLEKLRDERRRVQGIGGLGAAGDRDLEERVDAGPLGQEHAAEQRTGHLERLEEARRELGAQTEAFLELQDS